VEEDGNISLAVVLGIWNADDEGTPSGRAGAKVFDDGIASGKAEGKVVFGTVTDIVLLLALVLLLVIVDMLLLNSLMAPISQDGTLLSLSSRDGTTFKLCILSHVKLAILSSPKCNSSPGDDACG
jgi:hypothetical protein